MKKVILFMAMFCLVLGAEEIWLGMIFDCQGDSLIIADGEKVYCPSLLSNRYITEDNLPLDATQIIFPFTASLVTDEDMPEHMRERTARIKIHVFYKIEDGRLVERKHSR